MKKLLDTGMFIPDYDEHFAELNKKTPVELYQHDRINKALQYINKREVAVDVGAHIGLITRKLADNFNTVYAFEPTEDNYECLVKNTNMLNNVIPIKKALGEKNSKGLIYIADKYNSGGNYIMLSPDGKILVEKLDKYKLSACDLIKLDVQGFEHFVLKGAIKTIKKFHPVIIIEIENDPTFFERYNIQPKISIEFLKQRGYSVKKIISHDVILVWEG